MYVGKLTQVAKEMKYEHVMIINQKVSFIDKNFKNTFILKHSNNNKPRVIYCL